MPFGILARVWFYWLIDLIHFLLHSGSRITSLLFWRFYKSVVYEILISIHMDSSVWIHKKISLWLGLQQLLGEISVAKSFHNPQSPQSRFNSVSSHLVPTFPFTENETNERHKSRMRTKNIKVTPQKTTTMYCKLIKTHFRGNQVIIFCLFFVTMSSSFNLHIAIGANNEKRI